jgi:hypothetical protein
VAGWAWRNKSAKEDLDNQRIVVGLEMAYVIEYRKWKHEKAREIIQKYMDLEAKGQLDPDTAQEMVSESYNLPNFDTWRLMKRVNND